MDFLSNITNLGTKSIKTLKNVSIITYLGTKTQIFTLNKAYLTKNLILACRLEFNDGGEVFHEGFFFGGAFEVYNDAIAINLFDFPDTEDFVLDLVTFLKVCI